MMDLRTIQAISDEAARAAQRGGKLPYGFFDAADVDRVEASGQYPIPFLGSYVPRGFKRLDDELFVDTTGVGREDEPALTERALFERIRQDVRDGNRYYYAVTRRGSFQAYVARYEAVKVRAPRARAPRVHVPVIG